MEFGVSFKHHRALSILIAAILLLLAIAGYYAVR
jgi:hypothetical protein